MKNKVYLIFITLLLYSCSVGDIATKNKAVKKDYKVHTIAFYNVENLFDLVDDPNTVFHDRTPRAKEYYTEEVYFAKQKNLAKVINAIGRDFTGSSPSIVGLAEVENFNVINDLVNQEELRHANYSILHYDSPDLRGIDVGLIYKKNVFLPTHTVSHRLNITNPNNPAKKTLTRDQLVVRGMLEGESIYIIVHHWPSRSGGEAISLPNRVQAGKLNRKIIDSILKIDAQAKIINMGDFNDDPTSPSIKETLRSKSTQKDLNANDLYNPMEAMFKNGMGSLAWRDSWNLFDQIMVSANLVTKDFQSLQFYQAGIFNEAYLTTSHGKFKGYPFRSYSHEGWTGGYSDHFPVFIYLIKEK